MDRDIRESLLRELIDDPDARNDYVDMLLDSTVALQIKTLRQQRGWTQRQLAERAGMKQSRISAMERTEYSAWSLRTLRRLAQAFDLRLRVSFEAFGSLLDDYARLGREDLERPSFGDDPAFKDDASARAADGEVVVGLSEQRKDSAPPSPAESSVGDSRRSSGKPRPGERPRDRPSL